MADAVSDSSNLCVTFVFSFSALLLKHTFPIKEIYLEALNKEVPGLQKDANEEDAFIFTGTYHHHSIPDQAVALNGF